MDFVVGSDGDGMMLRSYLKRLRLSSALVSHLKGVDHGIVVNDECVTVRKILKCGDVIRLAVEDTEGNESIVPRDLPIEIVYEDDDIVVASKPPFMPTHPSHDHYDDTLANALAFRYSGVPFVFRPVNRLDRNTSGVVLAAKNARSASIMYTEMLKHRINKTYVAVTEGEFSGSGIIDRPLCRTEKSIIVRRVCAPDEPGAQSAETEYEVLACGGGMSLVKLHPLTGRTHQIRVHLASIGHPIVGDDLYGHESRLIGRQALHASSLTFNRPSDSKSITVTAPVPEDMLGLISAIEGKL